MTVTLNGTELTFVIDVEFAETMQVVMPNWINQSPTLDTNIWSRKPLYIVYTIRATHSLKWTLDQLFLNHRLVALSDDIYSLNIGAWFYMMEAEWDGETNYSKPWKITLTLIFACPTGNQISNGGFETGSLGDWDSNGAKVVYWDKHSGTYCCQLDIYPQNKYIEQSGLNVSVSCITEFKLWIKGNIHPPWGEIDVKITYTDSTTTTVSLTGTDSWVEHDLTSYLTSGKVIDKIKIIITNLWDSDILIDDVSLLC